MAKRSFDNDDDVAAQPVASPISRATLSESLYRGPVQLHFSSRARQSAKAGFSRCRVSCRNDFSYAANSGTFPPLYFRRNAPPARYRTVISYLFHDLPTVFVQFRPTAGSSRFDVIFVFRKKILFMQIRWTRARECFTFLFLIGPGM